MKMLANVMYIMLPSRLNEYPNGKMKLTMFFLQPKFSNSSVNLGNTASELVVENATNIGFLMLLINENNRFFKINQPTSNKMIHKTAMPV